MREQSATIVFSTVTTLVKLAEHLIALDETMPGIRVLMFSGEAFCEDQRSRVLQAFPSARIRSLIYGSFDAGVLGYSTSLYDSRQHAVSTPYVVLEIAPNGTISMTENGVPGRLLVTNLGRRLQLIIRYPSGDLAEWVDYANGKFRVLGRDTPGVQLGPVVLDTTCLRAIVLDALDMSAFQAVISRADLKDVLTLRVGHKPADEEGTKQRIAEELCNAEPGFKNGVENGLIVPLRVEFLS